MAMKLYPPQAPFVGTYDYAVHLDDTKLLNGQPDPAYVLWYQFAIPPQDQGETAPAYQTRLQAFRQACVNEVRGLARLEAQQRARVARQLANQNQATVDIT